MEDTKDIIGGVLCVILIVVVLWLYLVATPDQCSAECEALRQEMLERGLID